MMSAARAIEFIARYSEDQIFESGWLDGEKHLSGNAALTVVKLGEGRVVLYEVRLQHSTQTHGTNKLFFYSFFLYRPIWVSF
jgi:hypothetical protein